MESRLSRAGLALWTLGVVLFLWIPLLIILVYAFNTSNIQSWPIPGFTTHWFSVAWHDQEARSALVLSLKAALCATGVALVLGTMAAVECRASASSGARRCRSCSFSRSRSRA